jgi:hypothetical protein
VTLTPLEVGAAQEILTLVASYAVVTVDGAVGANAVTTLMTSLKLP